MARPNLTPERRHLDYPREYAGETVFIPRITLLPADNISKFKGTHFPVRLCYAMSKKS